MLAGIQAFFLFFDADPQRNDEVDKLEDKPGYDKAVTNGDGHGFELDKEKGRVAVQQAVGAGFVDRRASKTPSNRHAAPPADTVAWKHVQRIVKHRFGSLEMNGHIGDDRGENANE